VLDLKLLEIGGKIRYLDLNLNPMLKFDTFALGTIKLMEALRKILRQDSKSSKKEVKRTIFKKEVRSVFGWTDISEVDETRYYCKLFHLFQRKKKRRPLYLFSTR
jgi:hypothetical protein